MNIEIFTEYYSTSGTQEDRAEAFKLAAVAVYIDADLDRPFTGDETRAMLDAANAADDAVFYHSTPGGTE